MSEPTPWEEYLLRNVEARLAGNPITTAEAMALLESAEAAEFAFACSQGGQDETETVEMWPEWKGNP